ncbi:LysR family transcriptional regulator [Pseudoroseomonas cervicalis]|uniref:LysR family transcriptional regulator n=1 Tax=Teichococcus cervicalis TaxID=204525 RepID=UPI0027830134|nr:LysR family transcriptional regulator [Pseudoroseomonas cervicalis]MDQ1077906.1 DNA-binding transcriptional LysR family regulator [Pseudoroseomonas cervicalis]
MPALTPGTEHILAFLAVAEQGSLSAAAQALNRTQSSMTYAIQRLEAELGVTLFERGQRGTSLTPQGMALLPVARRMAQELDALRRTADGLAAGVEVKLVMAVEAAFPEARLLALLAAFRRAFPLVRVRMETESVHATAEALLSGRCALGILGPVIERYPTLAGVALGGVERIPVAAPDHPLALHPGEIPAEAFRSHVLLVLSSHSREPRKRPLAMPNGGIWRVNTLAAKRSLILAGLGWGRMPAPMVAEDLAAGRLVRLRPARLEGLDWTTPLPFFVAHRRDEALGPAASWARAALLEQGQD